MVDAASTGVDSTSEVPCVKRIGFLSFGHWTPAPYSEVRTASDASSMVKVRRDWP